MRKIKMKAIWLWGKYSVPVRDGLLAYLDLPVQNGWTAALILGIIIWAYKTPNKQRKI